MSLKAREPAILGKLDVLHPFPAATVRLMEAVTEDAVEVSELKELISRDPAIAAEVLKAANAALRARVVPVSSLDDAVMVLGVRGLAELVLASLCGRYLLEAVPLPDVALSVWRHSLVVGRLAADAASRRKARAPVAHTLGLLHEVGRLGLLRIAPRHLQAVADFAARGESLSGVENDILGASGPELTVHVARRVGIPGQLLGLLQELAEDPGAASPPARCVAETDAVAPLLGYPVFPALTGISQDFPLGPQPELDSREARRLSVLAEEAAGACASDEDSGLHALSTSPERAFDALLSANRELGRLNQDYASTRRELEKRVEETRSLADTMAAITMGLDREALQYSILEALLENYQMDTSFLVSSESGKGYMEGVIFAMGPDGEPDVAPLHVDLAHVGRSTRQVLMRGMALTLDESSQDPGLFQLLGDPAYLRLAPLMIRGVCSGILGIGKAVGDPDSGGRGDFLSIVAGTAALGLDNARLYSRALEEATVDPLTGVATRRAALEELRRLGEPDGPRPLGLLLVDLDHFKTVNDTLGHQAGDRYLKDVTAGMRSVIPEGTLLGRYGGDEFVVISPGASVRELEELGGAVRRRVETVAAHRRWKDVRQPLGATVGVAWWGEGRVEPEGLLAMADSSLYDAKSAGRNRVGTPAMAGG